MSNIVDGYGRPMVRVPGLFKYYVLPQPGEAGLTDFTIPETSSEHTLHKDYEVVRLGIKFRKRIVISYEKWITAEYCFMIQEFLEAEAAGYPLTLFPRRMNLAKSIPVYCSNSEIVLKIMKGGHRAIGMKGLVLEFTSIKALTKIGWSSITNLNKILETNI